MTDLIEILESFNRKERFHLVKMVLGGFQVSDEFKKHLKKYNIEIPEKHFAAMDYHLDWIYTSLICCFENKDQKIIFKNDGRIEGSQEDIDFLIAYKDSLDKFHLIFLEAKGVTGWNNKQMQSKCDRLKKIFGGKGDKWSGKVIPYLFLLSPESVGDLKINSECYRGWIPLDISRSLKLVKRCDERGKQQKEGRYWKIEEEHPFNQ